MHAASIDVSFALIGPSPKPRFSIILHTARSEQDFWLFARKLRESVLECSLSLVKMNIDDPPAVITGRVKLLI